MCKVHGVTIPKKRLLVKKEEELKAEFRSFFTDLSESRG
jgi:hypothetical protein